MNPPPTGWSDAEREHARSWPAWLRACANDMDALLDEIDLLGFDLGTNPLSRMETLEAIFRQMSDDLAAAAKSLHEAASDRRARISSGN